MMSGLVYLFTSTEDLCPATQGVETTGAYTNARRFFYLDFNFTFACDDAILCQAHRDLPPDAA